MVSANNQIKKPSKKDGVNCVTARLSISGMHCANCVANIEKKYMATKGVESVYVNLVSNSGTITYHPKIISDQEILDVLDGTQFSAQFVEDPFDLFEKSRVGQKELQKKNLIRLFVSIVFSAVIMCISMIPDLRAFVGSAIFNAACVAFPACQINVAFQTGCMFSVNILLLLLTIPVQFFCGWTFIKGAFSAIKNKNANMDVLVSVGTFIAFVFSCYVTFEPFVLGYFGPDVSRFMNGGMPFYETCAMLITFVLAGKVLETRAKSSTNEALEKLVDLVPQDVVVLKDSDNSTEGINSSNEGEKSNCKSGNCKSSNAKNEQGTDELSTDELGTEIDFDSMQTIQTNLKDVNVGDLIVVEPGGNIPVDGVVVHGKSSVDESMLTGESDAISKAINDKVTGGTKNIQDRLIIRVSCTNDKSVLASIIRAVSDAQSSKAPVQGIADKVAGVFVPVILVIAVATFIVWSFLVPGSNSFQQAIMCAVAVTVVACPCALGLATPTALAVGMGRGAQLGIIIRDGSVLEQMCKVGHVVFDKTGTLTMSSLDISVENAKILRPEAKKAVCQLNDNFSVQTYMLSGDKKDEALRIAYELGINENNVAYETTPVLKKKYIEKLKNKVSVDNSKCNKIVFVGDGINDAPALAAADIGIAMESGTDVALESGSVVLTHNNLLDVGTSIKLSKITMRKIKQNLFWSLGYNIVVVPLAAFGILLPVLAGAIHAVSSLLVVLNSLLLKRFK